MSWLQVGPLALILLVLFALPTVLFLVVSFFDYDRTGIYPAFMLDNYRELLTTPATLRVYVSSLKFAAHRLGDHAVPRLQHRLFPDLPRAQRRRSGRCCSCCAPSRS